MEIQADADLNAVIKIQPVFGKHADLVWAYVELFGITPFKRHTKKLRRLQEEMKTLFQSGSFNFQKKTYRISVAGIAEALNIVVHKHFETRLENHNYLKKVMISIAEQEAKDAGILAEKKLREKENRLQAGQRQTGSPEENKQKVKDLIEGIG